MMNLTIGRAKRYCPYFMLFLCWVGAHGRLIGANGVQNLPMNCTNNEFCDAFSFGVINYGDTLGDASLGLFDNLCADAINERNPASVGDFTNDAGVWFHFRTGNNPGPVITIEVISDPENTGDPLDVQMAIYRKVSGGCPGNTFTAMEQAKGDFPDLNGKLFIGCPNPNRDYYILVDGHTSGPDLVRGIFGIEVAQPSVTEAADLICEATPLGAVPEGARLDATDIYTNYCASSVGDADANAFRTQVGVWFEFIAPPSGHIIVEGIAEQTLKPLGIQLAVFGTDDGTCTGNFVEFGSSFSNDSPDETLEVNCLYPGERHWVLIDGFGDGGKGAFKLAIEDAGDVTPRFSQTLTLCAGDSLMVGNSVYRQSGNYADTLSLGLGCDSIVFTELSVLDSLQIDFVNLQPAFGLGEANGVASANVTGGTGNYSYSWCNGAMGSQVNTLVGNENCCVTVTDDLGCMAVACFVPPLVTNLLPSGEGSELACFGDNNGTAMFSIANGIPPYEYSWTHESTSLSGDGVILSDVEEAIIEGLPAGEVLVFVKDNFGETTFTITVSEPTPLNVTVGEIVDASCFGFCDGTVEAQTSGGTGSTQLMVTSVEGVASSPSMLCSGDYLMIAIDENGCSDTSAFSVGEPAPFVAELGISQDISCFGSSDGALTVLNEDNVSSITWSTGEASFLIDNLATGNYTATVTNTNGCQDTTEVFLSQPSTPVGVSISIASPIRCAGETNGVLLATVTGPGTSFTYDWNASGANGPRLEDVGTGTFQVSVTSDQGCMAMGAITLESPQPLTATYGVNPLTCLDLPEDGALIIETTTGGVPGYEFALEDGPYQSSPQFNNLVADTYQFKVKDAVGCIVQYEFEVLPPPFIDIDLGPDFTIRLGDSVALTPIMVDGQNLEYQWKENGNTLASVESSLMIKPTQTTPFSVLIKDPITQCEATDQVIVKIDRSRSLFAPNAFSPNGDGRNEIFFLRGRADIESIEVFRIFDRTGALLFEANNFSPNFNSIGWNGKIEGQDAPTGVYVYYAMVKFIDGAAEVLSGDLLLLR